MNNPGQFTYHLRYKTLKIDVGNKKGGCHVF
jgi:hypothetical protein